MDKLRGITAGFKAKPRPGTQEPVQRTISPPSAAPSLSAINPTGPAQDIPKSALLEYRVLQLPFYHFQPDRQTWVPSGPSLNSQQPGIPTFRAPDTLQDGMPSFRIASLNVWFENIHRDVRLEALKRILEQSQEDVFCLQELTKPVLDAFLSDSRFREKWATTNVSGRFGLSYGSSDWYGQCTLVNRHTATILDARDVYLQYEDRECRPLTTTIIRLRETGQRMQIINMHLQSLRHEGIARQEQIRLVTVLANQAEPTPTVAVGDTNFHTLEGLAVPRFLGLRDLWYELRPDEDGHTFAQTYSKPPGSANRLDCILYWPAGVLDTQEVAIFGAEPLQSLEGVYLSDHLGIRGAFTLSNS